MRRAGLPIALAAALATAWAPGAQAGKVLSFERARGVTEAIAAEDCAADPACDEAEARSCRRQAIRRIRCVAVTRDSDSNPPEQCTRRVLVRLQIDGEAVADPAPRSCAAMLPDR